MTAQILPFPGCKAIAQEAQLNNSRDNASILGAYQAAVIRGATNWAGTTGASLNQSIYDSLAESGIVQK